VDDIIARRRFRGTSGKRKHQEDSDESGGGSSGPENFEEEDSNDEESVVLENDEEEARKIDDPLATSDETGSEADGADSQEEISELEWEDIGSSGDDSASETEAQKATKKAFFSSDAPSSEQHSSFLTMNLSRPVLKGLTSLAFHTPTPIQAATIPVGLLGKDVVGNAVTGSGKTAAFIIPMIERLLYRDRGKRAAATRCLILVPTRELAVQCYDVGKKLAAHTDIQFCLVVGTYRDSLSSPGLTSSQVGSTGGLSLKSQEVALKARPDVVIATPGRLIDHLRNSPAFALDALDVLVLDEADRMLSDGFADELGEIIKACPVSRQTMLFSATMTDSVDELIKMSLNKPVRLFVDPKRSVARGLVQEFVRVRAGREADRSALLAALCTRTFKSGVIVFLRSKKLAHQLRVVFGLLGLSCEELHGDLTQEQVNYYFLHALSMPS
jgi:ATP-dependent RNA helicase DDX27